MEVRHLVLRGSNEHPILLDRMRGVAAAFGKSVEDDAWDFTTLGFTDLRAGCSIAHIPPSSAANGRSIVSRDYDFTTGNLGYGFLEPGMLHPTARPYLLELHPEGAYSSIAMVAYDLLSGVLDGINSEGLTVTLAMDAQIFRESGYEPTRGPAGGLGELQTLRLLLDTCATVEEAKETLHATMQYYQYVPIHYLIADCHGNAFVWEYSEAHNKEYVLESPGQPLVMTNFTLHKQLEEGKLPAPDKARPVCKRYAYLLEKLSGEKLDDAAVRSFHENVDAQASQASNPSEPPERTFWHAFYYPEERRVRVSYYLRDAPHPSNERLVRPIRIDYLEFQLEPTGSGPARASGTRALSAARAAPAASVSPSGSEPTFAPGGAQAALEAAGLKTLPALRVLSLAGTKVTDTGLSHLRDFAALDSLGLKGTAVTDRGLVHLKDLSLEVLNLADTKVTDAGLVHLKPLSKLTKLNVTKTGVTEQGVKEAKKFLPFWITVTR